MVASASTEIAEQNYGSSSFLFMRHLLYFVCGALLASLFLNMPIEFLKRTRFLALLTVMGMLTLVLIPGIGKTVNGSTRWINLGVIAFQPLELCKIFVIIYFAGFLDKHIDRVVASWQPLVQPSIVITVFSLLVLLQPDFGSLMVILVTIGAMFFIAGIRWIIICSVFLAGITMICSLVILEPYRVKRILTVANPWLDPFNTGYQLTQALIAIGRGSWWGEGLGQSVQKFYYLPEAHTDFLYAVFIEELGVVGGALLLLGFAFVLWRLFLIAYQAYTHRLVFHAMLVYGIATLFALQTIVNLGVSVAMLPTTGIPLPFVSYGGTSMVTWMVLAAIALRVQSEVAEHAHKNTLQSNSDIIPPSIIQTSS